MNYNFNDAKSYAILQILENLDQENSELKQEIKKYTIELIMLQNTFEKLKTGKAYISLMGEVIDFK